MSVIRPPRCPRCQSNDFIELGRVEADAAAGRPEDVALYRCLLCEVEFDSTAGRHLHPGRQAEALEGDLPALDAHVRRDHGAFVEPGREAEWHRAIHANDPPVDPAWLAAFAAASAEPGSWRLGRHFPIHVYEGDRPVATFHAPADAARAVEAVNGPPQGVVGSQDPDDGHLFTLTATSRMSSCVVGDEHHTDADWTGPPWSIEVRAWSLNAALRAAAGAGLAAWNHDVELFLVDFEPGLYGPFLSREAADQYASGLAAEAPEGTTVSWTVRPVKHP